MRQQVNFRASETVDGKFLVLVKQVPTILLKTKTAFSDEYVAETTGQLTVVSMTERPVDDEHNAEKFAAYYRELAWHLSQGFKGYAYVTQVTASDGEELYVKTLCGEETVSGFWVHNKYLNQIKSIADDLNFIV